MRNFNRLRVLGLSAAVLLGSGALAGCGGDSNEKLLGNDEQVGLVPGAVTFRSGETAVRPIGKTSVNASPHGEDGDYFDKAVVFEFMKDGKKITKHFSDIARGSSGDLEITYNPDKGIDLKGRDAENPQAVLVQLVTPEADVENTEKGACIPVGVPTPGSRTLAAGTVVSQALVQETLAKNC